MKYNICLISDLHYDECRGGAESSDFVLENDLRQIREFCTFSKRTKEITIEFLSKYKHDTLFIISNFINLSLYCQDFLTNYCKYIIIEHDYKCFAERHPTRYKSDNYFVPKDQLRNIEFYKNAKCVIYQTDIQKEIIEKNLEINNGFSINGNLFSDEDLEHFKHQYGYAHNMLYAIIDDENPIKGKRDAIKYAEANKLSYAVFSERDRKLFLRRLRQFKGIILTPTILESCSRLAIEAKLLGLEVISRNCPIMNVNFDLESITNCRKLVMNKIGDILNAK